MFARTPTIPDLVQRLSIAESALSCLAEISESESSADFTVYSNSIWSTAASPFFACTSLIPTTTHTATAATIATPATVIIAFLFLKMKFSSLEFVDSFLISAIFDSNIFSNSLNIIYKRGLCFKTRKPCYFFIPSSTISFET